jgi:hypothetical protein
MSTDITALIDTVQWLDSALKDRTGEGLNPEQLQVIFDFTSDGTERWDMLQDIAWRIGGEDSEVYQAAMEVLKAFEPLEDPQP